MIRERILSELKHQGLSQRQMALDLGLTPQNVSSFLRGKRQFPVDKIEAILKYLKIEL